MDKASLDRTVAELDAAKRRWARLPIPMKIDLLHRVREHVAHVADEWVSTAVRAKGIRPGSPLAGEEWLSGPYAVLTWIAAMTTSLQRLAAGADPLAGFRVWERPDGQAVVQVYPHGPRERLLLHGVTADVWMQPGADPDALADTVASFYRRPDPEGKVALVLGAGNIASIAPLDVLYKLYADGEVASVKLNPVNDYLGPVFERAFAPLVDEGYVRFVYGGGDVGAYLCQHAGVETIHITGSARTHDLIVYGPGDRGAARKARDERLLAKPITSELGGVGPTIVVPGPWTAADFEFQAEHLVTQKLHNSGHNCIASQVLVLPESWDGAERLLAALRRRLRSVEARPAYYPGTEQRRAAAREHYPNAEDLPAGEASCLLVTGVDASDPKEYAFTEEFFGPVWATAELAGTDAAGFLRNAVRFANKALYGTLGANIVIHPGTAAEISAVLDEAVADLRYGTVGVNAWTGVGYSTPRATWGAFPGHTPRDIQSGTGVVHNALLFDRPQKSVVRAPFRPFPRSVRHGELTLIPRPPWFVTNRTAASTGRRLTRYAADGGLRHIPGIFTSALRG
jgi:aldehyde dehydrogenase (NAD(P)+)